MSLNIFRALLIVLGSTFAVAFAVVCIPPLLVNPDVIGAFAAGFVNPFAAGYALDVIFCWLVLASWVTYEAKVHGIKHGWVALLLGLTPGVATGFAVYLLLRLTQAQRANNSQWPNP
jgi:Terpene cyclase DEP1